MVADSGTGLIYPHAITELKDFVNKKLTERRKKVKQFTAVQGFLFGLFAGFFITFVIVAYLTQDFSVRKLTLGAILFPSSWLFFMGAGALLGKGIGSHVLKKVDRELSRDKSFQVASAILPAVQEYERQKNQLEEVRKLENALPSASEERARLRALIDKWEEILPVKERKLGELASEWWRQHRVPQDAFRSVEALAAENGLATSIDVESVKKALMGITEELQARVNVEAHVLRLPLPKK